MKHIRTTSRQRRTPSPAITNFAGLLGFFINVNQQIFRALLRK